jgi:hypothetical protein
MIQKLDEPPDCFLWHDPEESPRNERSVAHEIVRSGERVNPIDVQNPETQEEEHQTPTMQIREIEILREMRSFGAFRRVSGSLGYVRVWRRWCAALKPRIVSLTIVDQRIACPCGGRKPSGVGKSFRVVRMSNFRDSEVCLFYLSYGRRVATCKSERPVIVKVIKYVHTPRLLRPRCLS